MLLVNRNIILIVMEYPINVLVRTVRLIVFNVIKFQQDQLQLLAPSVRKDINIHLIIARKNLCQIVLVNFPHATNA